MLGRLWCNWRLIRINGRLVRVNRGSHRLRFRLGELRRVRRRLWRRKLL